MTKSKTITLVKEAKILTKDAQIEDCKAKMTAKAVEVDIK